MRILAVLIGIAALGAGLAGLLAGDEPPAPFPHPLEGTPDLILTNARVVQPGYAPASVITIGKGRILAVGDASLLSTKGEKTELRDLGGATVIPGLRDSHIHLAAFGAILSGSALVLTDSTGPEQIADRVREWIEEKQIAPGEWVQGLGWSMRTWKHPVLPDSTRLLDEAAPRNPVYLRGKDGHTAWANRRALELAGITRDAPKSISGGQVYRDDKGEPTGVLADNAQGPVRKLLPPKSDEEVEQDILRAAQRCAQVGLVEVHDAGMTAPMEEAMRRLANAGKLPIRIYGMIRIDSAKLEARLRDRPPTTEPIGGRLTVRAVKLMADGDFISRGAYLTEPYADRQEIRGTPIAGRKEIEAVARLCLETGYQLCIHAIGDAAVHEVLDAYETALAGRTDARFRIEHASMVLPEDEPRFAKLGVIACLQPAHVGSQHIERIGAERTPRLFHWTGLRGAEARLTFGSDHPAWADEDPLLGMEMFVHRKDEGARSAESTPRFTPIEALRGYTEWPAYASFAEGRRGKILPGMDADLTVLSADPVALLTEGPEKVTVIKVLTTFVGGVPTR